MSDILHVCGWFDPAGDVFRCVNELNRVSKHRHYLIIREPHPYADLMQLPNSGRFRRDYPGELMDKVDAVVCHFVGWPADWPSPDRPMAFRNLNIRYDDRAGGQFWSEPQYNCVVDERYKLVAASHVGAKEFLNGEFRWLPDLLPIESEPYRPDFSSRRPCVSYIKHANELDKADFGIRTARLNLSMKPHAQVLARRKAEATVVIDNVMDGHWGLAGHEAISLGLPTIVFNHGKTAAALKELCGGNLCDGVPFFPVATIEEAIEAVIIMSWWSALKMQAAREDIRDWAVRYFSSKYLVPKFWDSCLDELLA